MPPSAPFLPGTRREAIAIAPARSLARSCQHTCRLFDRLQDVFPPDQLFLDVDNIAPGLEFVRVLNERVAECDIVLAVIGKGWLDARDAVDAAAGIAPIRSIAGLPSFRNIELLQFARVNCNVRHDEENAMIRALILAAAALAVSAASASADGYGWHHYRHHHYGYGYAVPVFDSEAAAYYGFPAPSYIRTPWPIGVAVPIRPTPAVSAPAYGYGPGY